MQSWKAFALVVLIFLIGATAGAFGMRAYMTRSFPDMLLRSRESMEDRIIQHIGSEVGLSDAQKMKLRPIIQQASQRADKVHGAVRAELEGVFREMDENIAKELDETQRVKFVELRKRMERFRRDMPPGPPPPGMPPGPPPPGGPGMPPGFPPPPPQQ